MSSGILDEPDGLRRLDRSDMLVAVAALPAGLADGWARTREVTLPTAHRAATSIALLGMGGSAMAGDLVAGVYGDRLTRPLTVVRDYELPAFVGPTTLVIASSFSGATEETIESLAVALERHCPVVVVTTGGPLLEVARRAELPHLAFEGGGQPRAALGRSTGIVAGLLERAGMLAVDDDEIAQAVGAAEAVVAASGPDVELERNEAKRLAWELIDRLPTIEAAGWLGSVARRWKTQLNENSKTAAAWEVLPEATHNAVVGYAEPETLSDRLVVVFLASDLDHPRNRRRAALSGELLKTAGIDHQVVNLAGRNRLAAAMSGVVLGDYVSVYLGLLYGHDPTPVEAITLLKARLAAPDTDA
jgi:glucose/mannose-6-phosphate isomerase